jgi:hypothetical protein
MRSGSRSVGASWPPKARRRPVLHRSLCGTLRSSGSRRPLTVPDSPPSGFPPRRHPDGPPARERTGGLRRAAGGDLRSIPARHTIHSSSATANGRRWLRDACAPANSTGLPDASHDNCCSSVRRVSVWLRCPRVALAPPPRTIPETTSRAAPHPLRSGSTQPRSTGGHEHRRAFSSFCRHCRHCRNCYICHGNPPEVAHRYG